jgi:FkbM family methyltransferase
MPFNAGELKIITQFIHSGNLVFDVGANVGQWTEAVLQQFQSDRIQIHCFEPHPSSYQTLIRNLAPAIGVGQVIAHNFIPPNLDAYCQTWQIKRIEFLNLNLEASKWEICQGANSMLRSGKIDYLQLRAYPSCQDADLSLNWVWELLQRDRYSWFKILPNGLKSQPEAVPTPDNEKESTFLAINERFVSKILGEYTQMLDLAKLCHQYAIQPRGIIHIGAYEGEEIRVYREMGIVNVLFVEANPQVFARLQQKMAGFPEVRVANYALCDRIGWVDLHIAAHEQSSSILSPNPHSNQTVYTREISSIQVEATTLDTLLAELQLIPEDYNLLNLDIQGAELLALQGATQTLQGIDGINLEVNYEEIYEGCPLIDEIDNFLEKAGFQRVATTTPYDPAWGDAFYVRKPTITMSTLGNNGGFANQLFQYGFLKTYARKHDLRVETPEWIGQKLFGLNDPPIARSRSGTMRSRSGIMRSRPPIAENIESDLATSEIINAPKALSNVDFWGFFQYHTSYYAPDQAYWRSLFQPIPEIEAKMLSARKHLQTQGKTLIAIHLRLGDYFYLCPHWIAPWEWYQEWLRGFWDTLENPVLYLASDEVEKVQGYFAPYQPLTARDLEIELPGAEFYPDFYILSHADAIAIANSTFSFAASLLNTRAQFCFRPHFPSQKLIPFDPWNSPPLFR